MAVLGKKLVDNNSPHQRTTPTRPIPGLAPVGALAGRASQGSQAIKRGTGVSPITGVMGTSAVDQLLFAVRTSGLKIDDIDGREGPARATVTAEGTRCRKAEVDQHDTGHVDMGTGDGACKQGAEVSKIAAAACQRGLQADDVTVGSSRLASSSASRHEKPSGRPGLLACPSLQSP